MMARIPVRPADAQPGLAILSFLMRVLTEAEVRGRLKPERVIAAIETAFRERYSSVIVPVRTQMRVAAGIFLAMPCYDCSGNSLGVKFVIIRDKPQPGEERVQATYMLLDPDGAQPQLIVEANYLTDVRTAATSAVATRLLAREDARVLGIFGTGRLARAHILVLPLVRRFERVLVCGKNSESTRSFARELSANTSMPVEPADARACAQSDVICACTASPVPLFESAWLRPGTHLNLVGSFQPETREADSSTMARSRIFVETYDGVLASAGDLLIPMREGTITRAHVAGDLHELVSGKVAGRTDAQQITSFKSVGYALEDLAAAELLMVSPQADHKLRLT